MGLGSPLFKKKGKEKEKKKDMRNIIWVEYKEKDHQMYMCTGEIKKKKTGVGLAREIWGLFFPVSLSASGSGDFFGCFWLLLERASVVVV